MYQPYTEIGQQVADQLEREANLPQLGVKNFSVFFFITFVLCKGDIALRIAKKWKFRDIAKEMNTSWL